MRLPAVRLDSRATGCGDGGKAVGNGNLEPCQPDTLTTTADAHPVHAVIPVTTSHQRQAMAAGHQHTLQGSATMFKQAGRCTTGKTGITIMFFRAQHRRLQKRHLFIQHTHICGGLHISGGDIDQPQIVIRATRPDAAIHGWMPPVLHVPRFKLVRGCNQ